MPCEAVVMLRFTAPDGVSLAVHDLGGDGPPLLLAHATGFHGLVWTPLAAALHDVFHCWSLDFAGHGDSEAPPDHHYHWHGFGDDVLAVVDGFGWNRLVAVGHSKGGAALAMAELARPATFEALYLYEPVISPTERDDTSPDGSADVAAATLRRREVFDSRDDAFTNFASKPPFDVLDERALRAYVDHGFEDQPDGAVRLKCRAIDEAAVYGMAPQHGTYERLGEITIPVTVAAGDTDTRSASEGAPEVAARIPNGSFERLAGLGHFGPLQDPERVAASIKGALRSTGRVWGSGTRGRLPTSPD